MLNQTGTTQQPLREKGKKNQHHKKKVATQVGMKWNWLGERATKIKTEIAQLNM
jgi:hypothetical protein